MRKIDLDSIIKMYDLDVNEIAKHLFPDNKYARLALNRVLSKKAVLDATQISRLAMFIDIPISALYSGKEWKSKRNRDLIVLTADDYTAELNTKTWLTKIYHKKSLFHEAVIHDGSIPLNEFINKLNIEIEKHGQS